MSIKYYLHKLFGRLFDVPVIPVGKTVGYSLIKSERVDSVLGEKARVYPPFFLHDVEIGDYSYVAHNSSISHCRIGKFSSIGPNFCCGLGMHPINGISTSPMFYSTKKQNGYTLCKEDKVSEEAMTHIGNDVFIGANVTILDGVTISDGAVIGAGAVVVNDIQPYAIAVGVPAIVKKYRFGNETIELLLRRRWWNDSADRLSEIERNFWDVSLFLDRL